MSNDKKVIPQETLNYIMSAKNMHNLEEALNKIDGHSLDEKKLIINGLEKHTLNEFFLGEDNEPLDKLNLEMIEGLMNLGEEMLGSDFFNSMAGNDMFETHSILAKADKVFTVKGENTDVRLKSLLEETAKLSDSDYNSIMPLSKVFMKVSKNYCSAPNNDNKKSNPYRVKYGASKPK